MHIIDENIPFTTSTPESVNMTSAKLETAYYELEQTFPNLISLLIVKDAQLVFERYQPLATSSSAYSIKSITKSIMNALVGIAIRDGHISSVDQYLTDHLQDIPKEYLVNLQGVTFSHLLTMTHGIELEENGSRMLEVWSSPNWISSILDLPLVNTPGKQFLYSTCTTHLLAGLLVRITGVPLSYYANKMLFTPLGISIPVYWESDPQGINWGGNNMFLTPKILARFGQLYLADGVWNGQRLLPSGWVEQSFSQKSDGWFDYAGYGYLWWVSNYNGLDYAFASGYGGQYIYVIPKLKAVLVLTANSDIAIKEMQATTNIVIKDPTYLIKKLLIECSTT